MGYHWRNTLTSPTIQGTVSGGTGLTMPAFTAGGAISAPNTDGSYALLQSRDSGVGEVEIGRLVGAASPHFRIGRDDTGVATNAVTDMLVLQAGAGTNNEAIGFGLGISVMLGNAASQVEERASIDFVLTDATDGDEDASFIVNLMRNGSMTQKMRIDSQGNLLLTGSGATGSRINTGGTEYAWIRNYFYIANYIQGAASVFMHGNCFDGTLTSITGTTSYINGNTFELEITTQNLEQTIARVAQVEIREPVITKGSDTITLAASLYINGQPTEGATNAGIYMEAADLMFSDGRAIRTGTADSDYFALFATDDDGAALAQLEVARVVGANDPYFAMGGSQEHKFYNSGVAELGGKVGLGAESDLTIATGAITVTKAYHSIIVQGGVGAGADQLDTAAGGVEGQILILKPNTSGVNDTVTIADGTGAGAFILAGGVAFAMDSVDDRIIFIHNGTEWVEIARATGS